MLLKMETERNFIEAGESHFAEKACSVPAHSLLQERRGQVHAWKANDE
jgi:hypothetical protein